MEWVSQPEAWVALATLTLLEIVLGIDNIVFISILSSKLPQNLQERARIIGLAVAMITRILLLFSLFLLTKLTKPLFSIMSHDVSGRDLILIGGGLFLLAKATMELHDKLEGIEGHAEASLKSSFASVITQIAVLDIVFSLDSVITAIGMAQHLEVMAIAIIIAVVFMMIFAGKVSHFIDQHPTLKVLALSFLLMIGLALIAEGAGLHIPKGYIYFAMGFSLFVEMMNLRLRERPIEPVKLRRPLAVEAFSGQDELNRK